ncbi:MAG TPA: AI-2E family transporter [Bryobacteraceae bacterium]|jgi:predicted PurR-regulated permease PerM
MLGIDRRVLRAAWTVFLFVLVLAAIYQIRRELVLFAFALFLANLLSPVVERVHWLIPPSGSRGLAAALVYLALGGIFVSVAVPVGTTIAEEAAGLANRLPAEIQKDPLGNVKLPDWLEPIRPRVTQAIRDRMAQFGQNVLPMLSTAGEQLLSGIGSLLSIILVPILSFFLLKDGVTIRRALVHAVDPGARALVDGTLTDLHLLLARYMRALLFLAMATFISYLSFLALMGVSYALLLAGIAATLEVIPVVGPLAGAAVVLLVAVFSGFPHLLLLIAFLGAYRVFQDYVLSPYLMSEGVEIHPVLVLLGVIAGERLGGIPGMFFAVPLIAGLRAILARMRKHNREAPAS